MAVNLKVIFAPCFPESKLSTVFQGIIKKATNAKVAVYTCGLDIAQTETKGTVLLKNAEEMLNFTTGEEKHMEKVGHPQLIRSKFDH